jgi:hypothetical protein
MLVKTTVLDTIQRFPDNFSIDELVEKLLILERVETGDKQSKENKVISETELEKEINEWFK